MSDAPIALVLDFVEWIAAAPRPRAEVIDVWRTSCPRLTVWEDAVERKLVEYRSLDGSGSVVRVTALGLALLADHGRHRSPPQATAQTEKSKVEVASVY